MVAQGTRASDPRLTQACAGPSHRGGTQATLVTAVCRARHGKDLCRAHRRGSQVLHQCLERHGFARKVLVASRLTRQVAERRSKEFLLGQPVVEANHRGHWCATLARTRGHSSRHIRKETSAATTVLFLPPRRGHKSASVELSADEA